MTNEELVFEIQHGRNEDANMDQLCRQNHGLIAVEANRCGGSVEDLDDMIQEGYIGLMDAVKRYDPDKGAAFSTFARYYIRKEIFRYLRECGHAFRLPPEIAALLVRFRWISDAYRKQYGIEIDRKTAAALLGVPEEKVRVLLRTLGRLRTTSLYTEIGEEKDLELLDTIPDPESETRFEEVLDERLKAKLWEVVDTLPEPQKAVLHKRYEQNATTEEIGADMGLSAYQVRLIHQTAVRRLREGRRAQLLRELEIGSFYHGTSLAAFRYDQTSIQERFIMRLEERLHPTPKE